jgi:ribosomal protein S18 acetylase RimI-like enzyme
MISGIPNVDSPAHAPQQQPISPKVKGRVQPAQRLAADLSSPLVERFASRPMRNQGSSGSTPGWGNHRVQQGIAFCELRSLPEYVQEQFLATMSEVFSAEWQQEDKRYKTPQTTYEEIKKQMKSTDAFDAIVVSYKKVNENSRESYELVATASMAKRDDPPFDDPYIDENGDYKRKHGDCWLMNVYTTEGYRHKGHAAHVIREIWGIAQQRKDSGQLPDFNGLYLYAQQKNVNYYRKLGFGVAGQETIPCGSGDGAVHPDTPDRDMNDAALTAYVMRYPAPVLQLVTPLQPEPREHFREISPRP